MSRQVWIYLWMGVPQLSLPKFDSAITVKMGLLMFNWNSGFFFFSLCSAHITRHHWKESGLPNIIIIYFYDLAESILLQINSPSVPVLLASHLLLPLTTWQMLQSLQHLCDLLLVTLLSVCLWEAQLLIQPMDVAEMWQRTRIKTLDLQTVVFLMKPTGLLAFLLRRAQCLTMVSVVPARIICYITFLVTEVWPTAL